MQSVVVLHFATPMRDRPHTATVTGESIVLETLMQTLPRLPLMLAVCALSLPAAAAERAPLAPAMTAHAQMFHTPALMMPLAAPSAVLPPKAMGDTAVPGTPSVNPLRAYPPSCAAYPLPNKSTGQSWTGRIGLWSSANTTETVTVTAWRIPCSSSGSQPPYSVAGTHNAMTLLRIDRDAANEGLTTRVPYMPYVQAAQGSITDLATDPKTLLRAVLEPNTRASEFPVGMAIVNSTTFVLESRTASDSGYFKFNDAIKLRVNPFVGGVVPLDFDLPAYQPTPDTYPTAFAPRPIDGYAAAQWVNGEDGLLVQVSEQHSDGKMTRQLVFDLLTKDLNGNPWWLVGNAAFEVGTTSLDVNAIYLGEGLSQQPWGKVNIEMPSCGKLDVTFTPNADLPGPVPTLSGVASFSRLFDANGMVCE